MTGANPEVPAMPQVARAESSASPERVQRRKKRRLLAVVAAAATTLLVAVLLADDVKPVGTLSRRDVIEIRKVVARYETPQWSWFTLRNLRSWPSFLRAKLTFRVVDIREDTIGVAIILPDGKRVENGRRVTVRCKNGIGGLPTNPRGTYMVEGYDGQWGVGVGFPTLYRPGDFDVPSRIPSF